MQPAKRIRIIVLLLSVITCRDAFAQVTLPFERHLRTEQERILLELGKTWHPIYPLTVPVDATEGNATQSPTESPAGDARLQDSNASPHNPTNAFTGNANPQDSTPPGLEPMKGFETLIYADILKTAPAKGDRSFRGWLNRKIFYESLIRIDTAGFKLTIDPMLLFDIGRERYTLKPGEASHTGPDAAEGNKAKQRNTWTNTRGIRIDGSIGRQFAFHSAFFESQAVFPAWMDATTRELHVVPGQAMYKTFKENGFDYAFAEGHISYSPSKYFNFRFGHGKNFIGEGYRSVLLSDAAFNYPYLAITTNVWHLQYLNLYSQHQDIMAPKGAWHPWAKKYATTHYLSWNIFEWLNIGVFESIVWQASDSTGQRGFELNYLNPVIFYRPVEFSLGSPDNALLGGAVRVTFLKKNIVYGQVMLDEFKLEHVMKGDGWWANKHGLQIGVKSFDPFGIPYFYLQAEYNHVRPYTYAHNTHLQNYAHYNQPLAHPQGANFREAVLIADKRIRRWQLDYKMVYAQYGADTAGLNFGHDVYKSYYDYVSEFGNTIGQGLKTTLMQHDLTAGWIINPATNLILSATLTLRNESSSLMEESSVFFTFGLRTGVFNKYNDF